MDPRVTIYSDDLRVDLRSDRESGYSTVKHLEDSHGYVAIGVASSGAVVTVRYGEFHLVCDRDAFDFGSRDRVAAPIEDWYERAMKLLLAAITLDDLARMLATRYEAGQRAGAEQARASIRKAMGL